MVSEKNSAVSVCFSVRSEPVERAEPLHLVEVLRVPARLSFGRGAWTELVVRLEQQRAHLREPRIGRRGARPGGVGRHTPGAGGFVN